MSDSGRVAVVHDWLTGMRGGEAILEAILDALPQAEIFTLFHFPGSVSPKIEARAIHTSSLQSVALRASDYRHLLPLFPHAVRRWDFRRFDFIVSSSHCVAKGIDARGKPHLCYCHTPMRYIWDRFDDYFPRSRPLRRAAAMSMAPWLRRWDVKTAGEVTHFVANSNFVRDRIRRYYRREAEVIHPFVDEAFLRARGSSGSSGFPGRAESSEEHRGTPRNAEDPDGRAAHVIVSALVPYKKIELAIEAMRGTERRLVILGGGPMLERLRERSGPNVELAGSVSRDRIIDELATARSLILPGVEDFGITPLEAMALGTPVVALGEGGVLDSVVDGVTGIFFESATVESLRRALDAVESRAWDRTAIRARAAEFSRARFDARFAAALRRIRT